MRETGVIPGLKGGDKGGVFFLHGEDAFRKEEAARALVDWHLDPATRDFNFDALRGSEVAVETLASVLATPPMMAEWRVVVLREVEALASSARAREVLHGTTRKPPAGLALILVASIPRGSKASFYEELKRHARALAFPAIAPNDVPGWLVAWAQARHGRPMTVEAARALGAAVGTDLGVLAQEVAKLASLVPEEQAISVEAVRAAGTHIPSVDRWAWFDRVAERDFRWALAGLGTLLGQGETGVGITAGLATHLLRVGVAGTAGAAGLKEVLPPHQQFLAGRLLKQARLWKSRELEDALLGLRRADRLLKSGSLSEDQVLEEWFLGLMAGEGAQAR
jgi:DNA polymerase-3 subunit delta